MATQKKRTSAPSRRGKAADNGLKTFNMHAFDEKTSSMVGKLSEERASSHAFSLAETRDVSRIDPETIAKHYLQGALASTSVRALSAPTPSGIESEFKSLGTDTVPLTNSRTVKFRQTVGGIPVYGSLVTVELDDSNSLVGLNSSMGNPDDVSPIAKLSPADAIKAVEKHPGFKKVLDGIVPHLNY